MANVKGPRPRKAHKEMITQVNGEKGGDPALAVDQRTFDNGLRSRRPLTPLQQELWDHYIRKIPWLTWLDVPRAHMWVVAQSVYEENPERANAHYVAQMRSLGSELGMDPLSRTRMKVADVEKPSEADKFFDDL